MVKVEGGTYGNVYRILGEKPERWVAQTDFTNDEAIGYLADRLAKIGVEDDLFKAGAVARSTVVIGPIGGVVFDWKPTLTPTAELLTSPRRSDPRLDAMNRPTRGERRDAYFERMDARPKLAPNSRASARPGCGPTTRDFEIESGNIRQREQ